MSLKTFVKILDLLFLFLKTNTHEYQYIIRKMFPELNQTLIRFVYLKKLQRITAHFALHRYQRGICTIKTHFSLFAIL